MTRINLFKPSSYIFLTIVIVVLLPVRTVGWGNKGHQVIARIATARLSTNARQAIAELLSPRETLDSVSTWADQIKTQRPKTRSWHFVGIPLSDTRYSPSKDCGKGDICIVEAIEMQITSLKDTNKDSKARAEALKFLVHLIGDLHQPFRVTTNTNPQDRSASLLKVTSLSGRSTSLLDVWDNELVDYGLNQSAKSVGVYATQLSKKFLRSSTNQGSFISTQGSVTHWALEAHRLPWSAYYNTDGKFMFVDPTQSWKLDKPYYDKNVPVVEGQLVRAGARLAKILNDVFNVKSAY